MVVRCGADVASSSECVDGLLPLMNEYIDLVAASEELRKSDMLLGAAGWMLFVALRFCSFPKTDESVEPRSEVLTRWQPGFVKSLGDHFKQISAFFDKFMGAVICMNAATIGLSSDYLAKAIEEPDGYRRTRGL